MIARAIAVAVIVAAPAVARAGGFSISELGVGRTGMAAVVANPDEPSAAAHNPAGLARLGGVRLYVSGGLAKIDTSFRLAAWSEGEQFLGTPEADGYYPAVEPERALAALPMIAATFQLDRRWFVGVSAYVANASGSAFDDAAVTRYHAISGALIAPVVTASVAHQVSDKVAIGVSLGLVNIRLDGRRQIYPIRDGQDLSGFLGEQAELDASGSATSVTWNAGVVVAPTPRLHLGAAIVGRVDAVLDGPVSLRYGPNADEMEVLEGTHRTPFFLPWSFAAGAHFAATRNLDVAVEGRYWLYRQLDEQRSEIEGLLFVREVVSERDFHDSYQLGGGARLHDLSGLPGIDVMAGLHFDRSPAPTRTVSLDQPTFDNIGLHAGARFARGRYRVGLSYVQLAYQVPDVTDSDTAPPSNFTGSGRTHLVTVSFEVLMHAGPLAGD